MIHASCDYKFHPREHALVKEIRPLLSSLFKATKDAAIRAETAGILLDKLSYEQDNLNKTLHIFHEIRTIQTALSKINLPGIGEMDVIKYTSLAQSSSEMARDAFEIRYGDGAKRDIRIAQIRSNEILNAQLKMLFTKEVPRECLDEVVTLLELFDSIKAGDDGRHTYCGYFRQQIASSISEKRYMLRNLQFPYNGLLSIVFDLITGIIEWHTENIRNPEMIIFSLVEEASIQAQRIVADFKMSLQSQYLSSDLKILDLAITELVSLLRQLLLFSKNYSRLFKTLNVANPGTGHGLFSIPEVMDELVKDYMTMEKEYVKMSMSIALFEKNPLCNIEDIIYIGTKAIRRSLGSLEIRSILDISRFFNKQLFDQVFPMLNKVADPIERLNAAGHLLGLLDASVQMIDDSFASLTEDLWDFSDRDCPKLSRSFTIEFRRTIDFLEAQIQAAAPLVMKNVESIDKKIDSISKAVCRGNLDMDELHEVLSSLEVVIPIGILDNEISKRIYCVLAKKICDKIAGTNSHVSNAPLHNVLALSKWFDEKSDFLSHDCFSSLFVDSNIDG